MRMIFTKGDGKFDLLEIVRTDGSIERIDCPKQRIIPHDMVHYAVEKILGARGFMRAIGAGETTAYVPMGGVEAESVERLVETIQADAWSSPGSAQELIDLYRLTCEARGHPAAPIDAEAVETIKDEVLRLQLLWDDVPVGGKLELRF